jgi:HD-like signal output (HDOD) protein
MEAELEIFGATHAEVGAYLLGLWGIPTSVIEALAFHHCPAKSLVHTLNPLIAVHIANGLVEEKDLHPLEGNSPCLDLAFLTELGFLNQLNMWRELPLAPS